MTIPTPGDRPTLHVSFSGGEARGYAHVGTLQAIEALGLRVTEVSGSSIGAFVAALVAGGYSAARLAELGPTLRRRDFLRYAWPERRIVANWCRRRADRQPPGWWSVHACRQTVGRLLDGARFRDLQLPCTIQVTDLTHGRQVGLTQATHPDLEVALAVSASMALPGLMTPVHWNGRALADGGAFVHLRRLGIGADRVVVSDVSSHVDAPAAITSLGGALSAYVRAREHHAQPPSQVQGRPVTVVPYGALVDRMPAFRHPPASLVRQVIAEASGVARRALHGLVEEDRADG